MEHEWNVSQVKQYIKSNRHGDVRPTAAIQYSTRALQVSERLHPSSSMFLNQGLSKQLLLNVRPFTQVSMLSLDAISDQFSIETNCFLRMIG